MHNFYLFLVIILFVLAISDLIVGVTNDAVNFLNSAIGSKAAPFKIIMIVAALGIIVGATFSSGLMEVARKGIFHPQYFYFSEIIIIFLAVMMTDVILLDLFNTFGLPTSTTVSIVFELLGAAVGISIIKILGSGEGLQELGTYINSAKALAIITGILLSVVIAFSVGALVQYLARLVFSFNYKKNLKYFGSIFGGLAITAITYFMLIKGAKGASFITEDTLLLIKENTFRIILFSLVGWTIIIQILSSLFKLNILKFIVLVGTFALAMAFAGNDLVNFIGVPIAGLKSYQAFIASPGAEADQFLMVAMTGKVQTNTYLLLMAGLIMVLTLWTSKKARSVVATTIDLSRQYEGAERFNSTQLSRSIVRTAMTTNKFFSYILSEKTRKWIESRFEDSNQSMKHDLSGESASFDLIRASINLVIASILIAFGTSLKLPLSTTYVTFMVAMGTSLADRAWGRESAVYRISGVFSVIGGWFLTAISAFTVAFILAFFIHYGGIFAILALVVLSTLLIIRTHKIHHIRANESKKKKESESVANILSEDSILNKCSISIIEILTKVNKIYSDTIDSVTTENLKLVKKTKKKVKVLNKDTKYLKDSIPQTISRLKEDSIETGHYYVQVLDYLRELVHSITYITTPVYEHIDNNHPGLIEVQKEELYAIKKKVIQIIGDIEEVMINKEFSDINHVIKKQLETIKELDDTRKKQIKRIKKMEAGTKNSILYITILTETKNLLLYSVNALKAYRDFIVYINNEH